jgi:hypothetical protein
MGGSEYVINNLPIQTDPDRGVAHLSTRVLSPYKTRDYQVEAIVRVRVRTFFGRIFGRDYFDIERRAVAEQQSGQGKMAIYVNSVDCDAGESMEFDGSNMHIHGWVHTEGGLWVKVSDSPPQPNFTAEKGTLAFDPGFPGGTVTRCPKKIQPHEQVADFVPGHPDWLPEGAAPIDWPVWYTPSQFGWYDLPVAYPLGPSPNRCRFKGDKIEVENDIIKVDGLPVVTDHGGVLPTGIYCARTTFSINGDQNFTGTITALAEEIKVNPSEDAKMNLQAYAGSPDPVLFFAVPNRTGWPLDPLGTNATDDEQATLVCGPDTKELQFNADNSTWSGIVFNPCTRTLIDQSDTTGSGAMVTKMLKVNGSGFDFTGNSKFSATILLALVE